MTTDWVSQDATDISDIVKVGDFYYADGTWSTALDANKTCIGIVFQTDPSRIGDKENRCWQQRRCHAAWSGHVIEDRNQKPYELGKITISPS